MKIYREYTEKKTCHYLYIKFKINGTIDNPSKNFIGEEVNNSTLIYIVKRDQINLDFIKFHIQAKNLNHTILQDFKEESNMS